MSSPNTRSSLAFLCIVFIISGSDGSKTTYNGYKVFRTYPQTSDQLAKLRCLGNSVGNLDFWSEPNNLGRTVDIMVPPNQFTRVVNHFHQNALPFDVMVEDVQRLMDRQLAEDDQTQRASRPYAASHNGIMSWSQYHRLNDVNNRGKNVFFKRLVTPFFGSKTLNNGRLYLFSEWVVNLHQIHKYMDDLAARYPQVAQVATIGTTYMNNPLKMIKLGTLRNIRKPAIWIDGGIHAREWISPATATYFIEQLITGYTTNNSVIRTYLDNLDWYILPVANPDGYEYSHTNSRMWRKNRSFSGGIYGIFCRGVDLNRNFGFHWNQGGASNMACAENYAGPKAFSEEESKSIGKFVLSQKENIKIFITMHSYGQFWMTPWGYTSDLPGDYQDLAVLANKGARAIQAVHGTSYTVGSSTNVLYTASGGSDDWAKGGAGIKYSYTMELRDKGRYGFFLPSSQIVSTGQETWEGIKVLADALINGLK